MAQVQNVLGAIAGNQSLIVTGPEGLRSLRLIENCYAKRTLMEMPWLTESESTRAIALAATPKTI